MRPQTKRSRRLKPGQISAIMKEKEDKAAEPFLKGLDHEVALSDASGVRWIKTMKLKKKP